jgi:hypothetical protein
MPLTAYDTLLHELGDLAAHAKAKQSAHDRIPPLKMVVVGASDDLDC